MELMPGFKHSDVGVIPEEWEAYRLGELLQAQQSIRYGIVQPGKFDATGCYMLRSQDYSKGWAGPDGMHKVSFQLENQYRNARIRHNDLVITVVGAGIGQIEVVPDWLDGAILSRSTARISIDEGKAARSYVRAFLEGPIGKRQILDCQKEGAQPVVSCLDLAEFFIAYPLLQEQRAIAQALNDIDELLAKLDQIIAKKRDLKQATMQQLLTGDIQLAGFNKKWLEVPLGKIVKPQKGQLITTKTIVPGHIPVIAGGKQPAYFHASANRYGKTITVSASGANAGYVAFHATPIFASDCSTISESEKYCIEFIYYALQLRQEEIYAAQTGGAQPHIQPKDLAPILIKLPKDVTEQTAIASVLSDMDTEISELEARRDKTRNLKQAMMQELLTGKTRLV